MTNRQKNINAALVLAGVTLKALAVFFPKLALIGWALPAYRLWSHRDVFAAWVHWVHGLFGSDDGPPGGAPALAAC